MENKFDGKFGVILDDIAVEASGHKSSFELKAGDTAVVTSWHAEKEYLNDLAATGRKPNRIIYTPDVAKILLASSEHSGKTCYIRQRYFFTIPEELSKKLAGKSFCITGALSLPREVFSSVIQFCGGEYRKAVTKNLDYLIMTRTDTAKADTAKKSGVRCITEKEFKVNFLGLKNGQL